MSQFNQGGPLTASDTNRMIRWLEAKEYAYIVRKDKKAVLKVS